MLAEAARSTGRFGVTAEKVLHLGLLKVEDLKSSVCEREKMDDHKAQDAESGNLGPIPRLVIE